MADKPEVRVFVSSPGDLGPERLLVVAVCRRLSQAMGITVIPLLWEGGGPNNPDVPAFIPDITGESAQAVIDEQVWERLGGYDIYVGLVWHRMGSPTGNWRSGTEAELQFALEKRRETGRPAPVLFYHKTAAPRNLGDIDPEQFSQVRAFTAWLNSQGLYLPFADAAELEAHLYNHLVGALRGDGGTPSPNPPPQPRPPPRFWEGRPWSLGEHFVGRDLQREAIAQAIAQGRTVVIIGGPGLGKSQLAAEYAHWAGVPGFWTPAQDSAVRTLAALAPQLGMSTQDLSDDQVAALVKSRLADLPPETLWIVDNLTDLAMIRDLAQAMAPLRLVITSRDSRAQTLPYAFAPIGLDPLDSTSAVALLCSRHGTHANPDDPAVRAIGERVGGLPLALEVLAVRLATGRITASSLLAEIDAMPNRAQFPAFQRALGETGANIARPESVFAVLAAALAALPSSVRTAIAPLGYLADAPVPDALLAALTERQGDALDSLLDACRAQSLLSWSDGLTTVHALDIAVIAATNPADALTRAVSLAWGRLNQINTDDPAAFHREVGHFERLLSSAREAFGVEHDLVLGLHSNLASGYRAVGRTAEAIALDEETLRIRERVLGPEHPDTLTSRSNLASGYSAVGRTAEAIALDEETLRIKERVLGPEHPATLTSRSNLAIGYSAVGRTAEAIALDEETLRIRERLLGPEHPDTLTSRNNLASGYRAVGRTAEAIALDEETLRIRERLLKE